MIDKAIEVNSDLVKFQIYSKNEFIHNKSTYYNEMKRERLSFSSFEKILIDTINILKLLLRLLMFHQQIF